MTLSFVADEGVDRPIVKGLRAAGYDVAYVAEMEPAAADERVLELARQHQAVLLTADKDFGELVFRQQLTSFGAVLIRLSGLRLATKVEIVVATVQEHAKELRGSFTVITPGSLRIREGLPR